MNGNSETKRTFNIIRYHNSPNTADYRGYKVYRKEKINVPEYGGLIRVAQYDNHFVFETPVALKGDSGLKCTCGSPAIIVGFGAYVHLASPTPTGYMIVCMVHLNYGHHATGESRWI